ncbi:MAG: hypothetical protein AAF844_00405 [Pseudomonadota bacterium]
MSKSTTSNNDEPTESPHRDVAETHRNGRVGSRLVSESPRVRVWHICLAPGESLPMHTHVLDYFWTATSAGRARSHHAGGRVIEMAYHPGDTRHFTFGAGEFMTHDLQNIGDTVLCFTTVEFLDSANVALPLTTAGI